ncbi:zinc metalloprotease [Actinomadura kijaniata]|uniref:zinc metalloprotease n=1 Tax=Actinomadura kijaniata TaxID=46161 RepID=UPI003F1CA99E
MRPVAAGTEVAAGTDCARDGAASAARSRGGGPRRDRADLGRREVAAMLADLRARMRERLGTDDERAWEATRRRGGPIRIPVRFHVITDGDEGRVPREVVEQQIATLNGTYGGERGGVDTGVRFHLAGYAVIDRSAWFHRPLRNESAMKRALHAGGPGTLNLYSAAVGADMLGFSTFPQWYARRPANDGVVVDYRTLPDGPYRNYNHGFTAVHEIGHWLGLFHTFENGCEQPGDGIADTPYEAVPAEGCPPRDTCSQPGTDPVHNFMDYGWDDCMHEFTPDQARRIRGAWAAYRASGRNVRKDATVARGARTVGGAR